MNFAAALADGVKNLKKTTPAPKSTDSPNPPNPPNPVFNSEFQQLLDLENSYCTRTRRANKSKKIYVYE